MFKKHRRGVLLLGILLILLSTTSSLFAHATPGPEEEPSFARVEVADPTPSWKVFGSCTGTVALGDLFVVTPDTDWTGDMTCQVTLINAPDLIAAYRLLVLEIEVWDSTNTHQVGTTEYLTLRKGTVDIEFSQTASPYYRVRLTGGSYISNRGGWVNGKEDPTFMCQILQR
ncbi:hypothetical protein ES704_01407 [subsurface metagenome]|jgi:hypothetical protein